MNSKDRLSQMLLKRNGIAVREKIVVFRHQKYHFKHTDKGYDIYLNKVFIGSIGTHVINDAIQIFKKQR